MKRKVYKLLVEGWKNYLNENVDDFDDFEKSYLSRPKITDDPDYIEWGKLGYMPIGKFGEKEPNAATIDLRRSTKEIHTYRNPIAKLLSRDSYYHDSSNNYNYENLVGEILRGYSDYYRGFFNDTDRIKDQVYSILEILKNNKLDLNLTNSEDFGRLDNKKTYDIVWEIIDKIRPE